MYVAVKERWVGSVDMQHWMEWVGGWTGGAMEDLDPRKGDFAVAWIATKLTEPVRLAMTAAITPTIARWMGRAPPKEGTLTERVKEVAQRAKEGLQDSTQTEPTSASGGNDVDITRAEVVAMATAVKHPHSSSPVPPPSTASAGEAERKGR